MAVADASLSLSRALEVALAAEERVRADARCRGGAADWMLVDAAHAQARVAAEAARAAAKKAAEQVEIARQNLVAAHKQTEVVRRAADRKRGDLVKEQDRHERKQMEQLASMMVAGK